MEKLLTYLAIIYVVMSQLCAIYFWYLWAKDPDNGFLSTIFIGPIVAEFKGLLWPFFI